ncbi:MAG: hypothetical protein SCABRO_01240 [Candidatus Scalindua brodae]|uniref:PIN domain protein n=1 Tax=Candidatus Scalindua brodae TaxID=237368 RepID=A0A0B0EK98_9BACT|nr:MAG: hypothetical protein SCABRO_01240 [Candidatus Scalindua brodae]
MKKFLIDSDILIDFLRGIEGARDYFSMVVVWYNSVFYRHLHSFLQ